MKVSLPIEELTLLVRSAFNYDPTNGVLIWSKPMKYTPRLENTIAGSTHSSGYIHINWLGRCWKAHQLVWIHQYGTYPIGVLDHIDGIKCNNKLENLRDVSLEQNRQNVKKAQKNNKLGVLGVQERSGKFRARIRHNKVLYNLGSYSTLEEAVAAYKEAKSLLHKGYAHES